MKNEKDMIKWLNNLKSDIGQQQHSQLWHYTEILDVIARYLESTERPKGEWIEVEVFPEVYDIEGVKTWGSEMQCDQCGFRFTAIEGHIRQYNFCPNCGAKMKGGDTE